VPTDNDDAAGTHTANQQHPITLRNCHITRISNRIHGNNEQTSAALMAAASIQLGCEIQNMTFIPSQRSTAVSIGIAVARFLVSFGDQVQVVSDQ